MCHSRIISCVFVSALVEFLLLCLLKQVAHSSPVVVDLPSTMCYGSRRDQLLHIWRPSFKMDQYTVQELKDNIIFCNKLSKRAGSRKQRKIETVITSDVREEQRNAHFVSKGSEYLVMLQTLLLNSMHPKSHTV